MTRSDKEARSTSSGSVSAPDRKVQLKYLGILDRYLLREIAAYFGIALFLFTALLLTFRMLRFANLIVNRGVGMSQIGMVFLSIIPTFLEVAIPLATLLGVLLAFTRLSGDSELIVIRGSGISIFQLIRSVALCGLISALGLWVVQNYFRPWGNTQLNITLYELARSRSTAGLESGVFNKLGAMTLYAQTIDHSTGKLEKVLIDDKRDPANRKIVTAQSGKISSNDEKQQILFELADGQIHQRIEDHYSLTHFETNALSLDASELYSEDTNNRDRRAAELSNAELEVRITQMRDLLANAPNTKDEFPVVLPGEDKEFLTTRNELRRKGDRSIVELGRRLSMPCAAFLLALLALPLGVQPSRTQRTYGIGLSAMIGLVIFMIYYGVLSIGIAAAEAGNLNPYVALWTPNLILVIFAIWLNSMIGSERWQSVGVLVESIAYRVKRRFARFRRIREVSNA